MPLSMQKPSMHDSSVVELGKQLYGRFSNQKRADMQPTIRSGAVQRHITSIYLSMQQEHDAHETEPRVIQGRSGEYDLLVANEGFLWPPEQSSSFMCCG